MVNSSLVSLGNERPFSLAAEMSVTPKGNMDRTRDAEDSSQPLTPGPPKHLGGTMLESQGLCASPEPFPTRLSARP